jgi:hypothetical protein
MANYAHITTPTGADAASGGYKNVFYFAPLADFLVLSPVVTPVVNLGDDLTISAVHTFTAPAGFFEFECVKHSVTLKSTTVGDDGAQELEHTSTFQILGDSASNQKQFQNLLNADGICMLKDAECGANQYIQLGNDCVTPSFKLEFDGKTTKEGKKVYTITVVCKKKYFYNYAVTKQGA